MTPPPDVLQLHNITSLLQVTSFSTCLLAHAYLLETGLVRQTFLNNLLLRAYGKLGFMQDAVDFFHSIPHPNVVSSNTIMAAYIQCEHLERASVLFSSMVGRNIVSWNTLISAHAQEGNGNEAIALFYRMHQESKMPNNVTFINLLTACSGLEDLKTGKLIHLQINECGLNSEFTVGTALVNMYGKCGDLSVAYHIFQQLKSHDIVSWTTLICAYTQHGDTNQALVSFQQMQQEGRKNPRIYLSWEF